MDIHDLVPRLTLEDVRVFHREGTLKLDTVHGLASLGVLEPSGELTLDLTPISWGARIETWFRVTLESEKFRLVTAVAVVYTRPDEEEITASVQKEFLERVSVMAAYPYLRADLQSLASELRVGVVTLGILRPGEFTVTQNEKVTDQAAE